MLWIYWIQTSQTGGHPSSNTSPYREWVFSDKVNPLSSLWQVLVHFIFHIKSSCLSSSLGWLQRQLPLKYFPDPFFKAQNVRLPKLWSVPIELKINYHNFTARLMRCEHLSSVQTQHHYWAVVVVVVVKCSPSILTIRVQIPLKPNFLL